MREDEGGPYVRYRGEIVRHEALAPYVGEKVHVIADLTGEGHALSEWLPRALLHPGGWRTRIGRTIVHYVERQVASTFLLALFLAAPALAAPPAPPGPLAALAHQAAVEAAEEEIASQEPDSEAGDPLERLLWGLLAEEGEELAEDEPQEGQEEAIDPAGDAEPATATDPGSWLTEGLTAAGWCAVYRGEPEEGKPGCDMGVGAALPWKLGPVVFPIVIGLETAGFGVAVILYRSESVTIAVAGGVVAPYDERGIRLDGAAPALGATFGLGGR